MERIDLYFFIIICVCIYAIRSYNVTKKNEADLTNYQLNLAAPLHEDMGPILDNIISEALNEYRILNLGYKNEYINDKQEKDITDIVKNTVSLQYNRDTLADVIAKKIILHVTAFVVENNTNQNRLPNESIKG